MAFTKIQDNSVAVLRKFIKLLKIPVSPFTIKKSLQTHPNYPSLLSLSDCLGSWNIPHEAYKVTDFNSTLDTIAFPFIAHFKLYGGIFALIHGVENGKVKYSDEKENNRLISQEEFSKRWDGIILRAEKNASSGESNYKQSLIKGIFDQIRLPFLVVIFLTCTLTFVNLKEINIFSLALKLIGIFDCAILLMYSINNNNPIVQNLCTIGGNNDCNAILKSEASKITDWLSWSEVGMFYFFGSFLLLIITPLNSNLVAWLNIICLPYTFYSIGYQIKMKKFCILCCTVQILLWLEALNNILSGFKFQSLIIGLSSFNLSYILCFLIPVSAWAFLKPFMLKAEQIEPLNQQLKKFKYDGNLFSKLLTSQTNYVIPDELMPAILGNSYADTVITMVSNPFCGPCARTHKILDEWLDQNENIQLKIIFTTSEEKGHEQVVRHIIALNMLKDKDILSKAINDWYSQTSKDYNTWAQKYPVNFTNESVSIMNKQKDWCDYTDVKFTPTIFINGYKLVEPYQLDDIRYFLD